MESDIYRRIGGRIKETRKELGFTQETLAFKARITPGFLSHIERGTKKFSLETIEKLAAALNVPMEKLCMPAQGIKTFSKTEEELYLRRLGALVRDKDPKYKKLLWRVARYLAEKEKEPSV